MTKLLEAAKAKLEANKTYHKAIRREMGAFEPLGDSEFLAGLDCLIEKVTKDRKRGVESIMHNLMCSWVYGTGFSDAPDGWPAQPDRSAFRMDDEQDKGKLMLACWEQSVRFRNHYEQLTGKLSKMLWEMPGLERGDDGYGDLIDSLPLAGRAVLDGLFREEIVSFKQLEKALADNPLKDFILNGENYIQMKLTEALEQAYLSVARDLTWDEEAERKEYATPHVVLLGGLGDRLIVLGPYDDDYDAEKVLKQRGGFGAGKVLAIGYEPVKR
jgi:hypothetical protein